MPIPIMEACKKRKRKPKLFCLHTFGEPNSPSLPKAPFRDKVRDFLQECAEIEDYTVEGMPIWCTLLFYHGRSLVVPLYTIEEDVNNSPRPYCDHCRCTGWSNHYVSKRKYHFLIPEDSSWNNPLDEGVFDCQSHLLHGLIHCNGYGHLLSINGVEGGSKYLCGREIMDLWDRICNTLQARKITVADSSKKRSMELRVLHGVAYRHPWFGRWGYGFCHGSFGVKEHNYRSALDILCTLELNKIIDDFSGTDQSQEIKQIIRIYRDISETQLITLNDLLKFMLTVKSRAPPSQIKKPPTTASAGILLTSSVLSSKPPSRSTAAQPNVTGKDSNTAKYKRFGTVVANMDSRWPPRRLEYAADVIVGALKEKKENSHFGSGGMTRQDVRDAARLHIGDTGLLDYVLKSLNNVLVGNQIVRRAVNPATRILEYTITEARNVSVKATEPSSEQEVIVVPSPPAIVPGIDVYNDVAFLYKHVLLEYPESELVELAVQIVLDTKHFVKEWPFCDEEEQLLAFIARFVSSASLADDVGDIVNVPLHATIGDLKEAVGCALRDTYCVTAEVEVMEIDGLEEVGDGEVLFGKVESGAEIRVRGFGLNLEGSALRYQGGFDAWKVVCECGARDDDGERMVACDICEVWQHTRCCGIDDTEMVPPLFVCSACCHSLAPQRADHGINAAALVDDLLLINPSNDYGLAVGY